MKKLKSDGQLTYFRIFMGEMMDDFLIRIYRNHRITISDLRDLYGEIVFDFIFEHLKEKKFVMRSAPFIQIEWRGKEYIVDKIRNFNPGDKIVQDPGRTNSNHHFKFEVLQAPVPHAKMRIGGMTSHFYELKFISESVMKGDVLVLPRNEVEEKYVLVKE